MVSEHIIRLLENAQYERDAARAEAIEYKTCLDAAMAAIHRIAATADIEVDGDILAVTVGQIVEKLERASYDAETARIHAEEARINEYEMWGSEGRPR